MPRIFSEYDAIKRDYPMNEFLTGLKDSNVVKSVYVQTNWAKERAVEEVEWGQAVVDETGWPHAIVGFVDLEDDNAHETLAKPARSTAAALAREPAIPLCQGTEPDGIAAAALKPCLAARLELFRFS